MNFMIDFCYLFRLIRTTHNLRNTSGKTGSVLHLSYNINCTIQKEEIIQWVRVLQWIASCNKRFINIAYSIIYDLPLNRDIFVCNVSLHTKIKLDKKYDVHYLYRRMVSSLNVVHLMEKLDPTHCFSKDFEIGRGC